MEIFGKYKNGKKVLTYLDLLFLFYLVNGFYFYLLQK